MKLAVILFNLGGPDRPEAVEPFLYNLFSDPAIIALPGLLRKPLARYVAKKRAPAAREIYAQIGGRSPILENTEAQARAIERGLAARGVEARAFIAMRCWHPMSDAAAAAVKTWAPDRIVLLPLYPQFSTTTTASSFAEWDRAAARAGLALPTTRVRSYPIEKGFIAALAATIRAAYEGAPRHIAYRLLLSAHGLPKRIVAKGDPYPAEVEATAAALVDGLGISDWRVCYQSRVGPLEWIGPATDEEIRKAAAEGKGVVIAPIAFVSEHSETLVELDIEYAKLAREAGAPDYRRARAVATHPDFIAGLCDLVGEASAKTETG